MFYNKNVVKLYVYNLVRYQTLVLRGEIMTGGSINRQIGSVFMIMGTEIGAGVLALPIIISHVGIFWGSIILFMAWAVMLYTALLVCEANSTLDDGISFASMAYKFMGTKGKWFLTVIFWATLYTIIMAYISAAGSTFNSMLKMSPAITSTIFVIVFGSCVIIGTKAVDYVNRGLLSLKLLGFIIAMVLLCYSLHGEYLLLSGVSQAILASIPAIVTTFILHNIIPTVRRYLRNNLLQLRKVVIIGSIIPLVLYIFWVVAIIGNIPAAGDHGFTSLHSMGNEANVGDLMNLLATNVKYPLIMSAIHFVATISVTTSFLGTAISLYHFIQDVLGSHQKPLLQRISIPSILTFVVPLAIVLLYPNIFILALGFAGVGASILFILIPVLMMRKMLQTGYQCDLPILTNQFILNLVFVLGCVVVVIQFLS